ncbi:MAG: ComEA family DNA-binding protein [Oscillospiraceae bacterium]|nr:ComEA family DNA-binding protein [Oscillospiraceae bacterium]
METKEKTPNAYLWIVLLTLAFALLLFLHIRSLPRSEEGIWRIDTQYSGVEESAPVRERVNVTTASAEDLETLTGIGPSLAEKIVKEREENGTFDSLEDLLRVKGIGESKLEEFRYEVTTGEEK